MLADGLNRSIEFRSRESKGPRPKLAHTKPSIIDGVSAGAGLSGCAERELGLPGSRRLRYFAGGTGPPILLVHGLGGSALNWVAVAPKLVARRRVLVPDLPGHGRSSPLPGLSTLTPLADSLAELLRREGTGRVPVVGHSLGGLVALRLAVREPAAVSGVLLAAAAGISSGRRAARYALRVLAVVRPGRRLAAHRGRIAASTRLRRAAFGWWGAADPDALSPAVVDGFLAGWELHTDTRSAARALVADDPRPDLEQIRCPALVVWGARDNQVGVADAFEYARRLRAPVRLVPGCGHLLIGERPDAVLDAVDALLDRIRQLDEFPLEAEALG
jgi:pimeloyl-ACP methyl ester carboxylesterase